MKNWKLFVKRNESDDWLEWESYGNLDQARIAERNLSNHIPFIRIEEVVLC